jgi:hypothetical protein
MKKSSDLFTDEEKKQLSYLGSMFRREPTQEEEDFQKMVDAVEEHGMMIKGKIVKPSGSSGSRVRAPHYYEVLGNPGFRDSTDQLSGSPSLGFRDSRGACIKGS